MTEINNPELIKLLTKIHEEKYIDFTQYKPSSLLRRINSRMARYNITSYTEYVRILEKQPEEYNELINALTINVTEFFRNPESFKAISDIAIPQIIFSKRRQHHKIIRAWSCGCSSGDEPFSLAMLFVEKLGAARENFLLTIIGSDLDKKTLDKARSNIYTKTNLKAINKIQLKKYFDQIGDDEFKLKNSVANMVRFRQHDVIKDHPFMHCDIILCRNLLIYFNKQLQEEILLKFYECLNPGGFLILGMTETLVGSTLDAFEHVNNALRIYRRPTDKHPLHEENEILSQKNIDSIVNEMLGREE